MEQGLWSDGSIGLGHRMLWTTPESLQEKLPLVSQTGDLVLTADARIDNRDELILGWGSPTIHLGRSQIVSSSWPRTKSGARTVQRNSWAISPLSFGMHVGRSFFVPEIPWV